MSDFIETTTSLYVSVRSIAAAHGRPRIVHLATLPGGGIRANTQVYDYFLDWDLLATAFRGNDPDKLLPNIDEKLLLKREIVDDPVYQRALNRTFTRDWPPHHALADARAIMAGYKAWSER
jgi:hypothetical protein